MRGCIEFFCCCFLQVLVGVIGVLVVGILLVDVVDVLVLVGWFGDMLYGLGVYVCINVDGSVLIGVCDLEIGIGVVIVLVCIIVDEFDVDWFSVKVIGLGLVIEEVNGKLCFVYCYQFGGIGSLVLVVWNDLCQVGVLVYWLLIQVVVCQFGVFVDQLCSEVGCVISCDGCCLDYGSFVEVVVWIDLFKVLVVLKMFDCYMLIGYGIGDVDVLVLVIGVVCFVIDYQFGDVVVVVLVYCLWFDGSLDCIDIVKVFVVKGVLKVLQLVLVLGQVVGIILCIVLVVVVVEIIWVVLQGWVVFDLKWKFGVVVGEFIVVFEQQVFVLVVDDDVFLIKCVCDDGDVIVVGKKVVCCIEVIYV